MSKDTSGAAFPGDITHDLDGNQHRYAGLTKREYFAAKALPQAMIIMDEYAKKKGVILEPNEVAKTAYMYADAMLAELERE